MTEDQDLSSMERECEAITEICRDMATRSASSYLFVHCAE